MRVPPGVSLREWIPELIHTGKLYKFYKTSEWYELRDSVMDDHHHECERCEELGAWEQDDFGQWFRSERNHYSRADTVHHDYEVKKHPDMALTRWIAEQDGTRTDVLHPLCNKCHNEVHERFVKPKPKPQLNEERW